ncbi:MAG: ATP synthase F1 subunit gamma [Candidatus Omnitrophica bacterium]|nr:ATP synthase F1 subunit gamma [Candidatus Omnitrophota bacterium]
MSGKLRELKNRIRSVENTKKITRAMEMVAASKLRRFQTLMSQARPYTLGLESLLKRLNQNLPSKSHPFFESREEKKIGVVLMTSDSGLCGSYNLDLLEHTRDFLRENKSEKIWIGVGKAGIAELRRLGCKIHKELIEIRPARFDEILNDLKSMLESLFLSRQVDAVYVIYSHSLTSSSFADVTEKLLPLAQPASTPVIANEEKQSNAVIAPRNDKEQDVDYIFEPSPAFIFDKLIPLYFESKVRQVFLEAIVSEQIARMTAMHAATQNAKEMISSLVLERNKARQASITKEIIEIVSGSQALKIK